MQWYFVAGREKPPMSNAIKYALSIFILLVYGCGDVDPKPGTGNIQPIASSVLLNEQLIGSRFRSKEKHEGGLGPQGVAMGYWHIEILDDSVVWHHSDVTESGKYTVVNENEFSVRIGRSILHAYFDAEKSELEWDGMVYELVDQ
jgi:hypothetical protein